MDQTFSRPIRITGDGSATNQKVLERSTRAVVLSVKPGAGDVVVTFRDGISGQPLWTIEADNAAGSHSDCFGSYPLLFKNGIYMDVASDSEASGWVVNVAVIEPMSSGT